MHLTCITPINSYLMMYFNRIWIWPCILIRLEWLYASSCGASIIVEVWSGAGQAEELETDRTLAGSQSSVWSLYRPGNIYKVSGFGCIAVLN